MKLKLKLIVSIISLVFLAACSKFVENAPGNNQESIEDLIIPNDFEWKNYKSINFDIITATSKIIKITSTDGQSIFHKGFYNLVEETYNVNVNIPANITEVLVNGQNLNLHSMNVSIDLDAQSAPMKTTSDLKADVLTEAVSYWQFNESAGNQAFDSNGNNTGQVLGANWVDGINSSALKFNGENGKVIIPTSSSFNFLDNQYSVSLWFKKEHKNDDGAFIFHHMKHIIRIDKWGKILFAVYNPDWSYTSIDWSNRIIDTDWHHLVATYDGSNLKLYIDNELLASKESSGNLRSSASDLFIGSQTTTNYFEGSIDEVSLFHKALNVNEIESINATTNPSDGSGNLVSHWDLNEAGGTTANDIQGNNDGQISGASWINGINGSGLSFDGENDYVSIPKAPNMNVNPEITIMAWVRTRENKTCKIAQKGDWDGHGIGQDKWSGWRAGIRLSNNSSKSIGWGNGIPIFDQWYHVAMTYDGNVLKLYVNGQLKNSLSASGSLKINNRDFSIGSDSGNQKFFKGDIDDVRMYDKALSHTEIQTIFQQVDEVDDSDGDGIPDNEDDYPEDPSRAMENTFPASGYGSLAFEDLWPGKGDYDFNDLVIDYRFTIITNAQNKVSDIQAKFVLKAIGAGFSNGFGFQLPNNNIQSEDVNVSGYNLQENYITLNDNGIENGQNKITVIVFDNAKKILNTGTSFVNVNPGETYVTPDTLSIDISFNSNTFTLEDIDIQNFNPFLIVDGERGKEIHLPDFEPTSLANSAYFGTMHDNSIPQNGRYYKTENNLPWAINIPVVFNYTIEKAVISNGHLKFAEWAESGGTLYPDWYEDKGGYRNESNIFQIPN